MNFNPRLLINVLEWFDSDSATFGFNNNENFNELLTFLSENGVVMKKEGFIDRSVYNKIYISLLAIKYGIHIVDVCSKLNWHDFELFSSEILKYHDYLIYNNFRLKNPRREIDVVGIKSNKALLIDCKHWKKNSVTGLLNIIEKQKHRCLLFLQKSKLNIRIAFPIILTFLPVPINFLDDVPIVPVDKLNSFLMEFDCNYNKFYFSSI